MVRDIANKKAAAETECRSQCKPVQRDLFRLDRYPTGDQKDRGQAVDGSDGMGQEMRPVPEVDFGTDTQ